MTAARVLVISPVRDEAAFIPQALDSMLSQQLRPSLWVVVDDGSRDSTPDLIEQAARDHDWIRLVRRPIRDTRVLGSGVVHAFNEGLASVYLDDFDFVSKLDADIVLPPTYYSSLVERMTADPRLGTASGRPFVVLPSGEREVERGAEEMSAGMAKLYRVSTFRDIGGLVPEIMWDGIDCHEARVHGWRSRAFAGPDVDFHHLRPEGSSDRGVLRGRRRHGYGQWFMGTDPVFMLASAALRASDAPRLTGSLHMLAGYAGAALRRVPRYGTPGFRGQLRRFQRESLVLGKHRATQRWERRAAQHWPGTPRAAAVAYLVSEYPSLSHTFIAREIEALRGLGWQVTPVSVRQTASADESVVALQGMPLSRLIRAIGLLLRHPVTAAGETVSAVRPHGTVRPVGFAYLVEAALLLGELRERGVTHVHVHFANNAAEIARLAARLDRASVDPIGMTWSLTIHGLWMHGQHADPARDTFPEASADRWGLLADKIADAAFTVCVSAQGAQRLHELLPSSQVPVLHVGVDTDCFAPQRSEASGSPDTRDITLLSVGRFAPEKNLDLLLRALARLTDVPGVRLRLVGAGPLEPSLRDLAQELNLQDRIEWLGPVRPDDLPALYQSADIFVLTSLSEGIPVVLMEALASELPVIATRVGGIPELVQSGENGILIDSDDVEALSAAIRDLAAHPGRRRELGRRGRERVLSDFNLVTQARALSELLSEAQTR